MTPNQKEAYDHMQKALEKLLPMARKHGTLFGSINPWTEACDIGDAAITAVKNVQNEQLRCGVLGALYTAEQMRAYGQSYREQALEEAASVCEAAIASIWDYHDDGRKQIGTTVCNNLAAAIRKIKEQP